MFNFGESGLTTGWTAMTGGSGTSTLVTIGGRRAQRVAVTHGNNEGWSNDNTIYMNPFAEIGEAHEIYNAYNHEFLAYWSFSGGGSPNFPATAACVGLHTALLTVSQFNNNVIYIGMEGTTGALTLNAKSKNTGSIEATDVSGSFTLEDSWLLCRIRLIEDKIEYYINGTLMATHDTELPAGALSMPAFGVTNVGGSGTSELAVSYYRMWKET
tara:strand:- start:478 stop:1116 length:639 start_codon:yes stop_codon:yes gene_type:complete